MSGSEEDDVDLPEEKTLKMSDKRKHGPYLDGPTKIDILWQMGSKCYVNESQQKNPKNQDRRTRKIRSEIM